MEVIINRNQPESVVPILREHGRYVDQKFLIDTGFTGTIIFVLNEKDKWDYSFYNVLELSEKQWVQVANGVKVKTFSAYVSLDFNEKRMAVRANIIEGKETDEPIIGITFLKEYKRKLLLDFKKDKFRID